MATGFWESRVDGPDEIELGLYLGGFDAALNKDKLERLGVTRILQVADGLGPPRYPASFQYTIIEIEDSIFADIAHHFDECFEAIEETRSAGGSVLVHCLAGMSRSATVVIAYLMKTRGMSLTQALGHVKSRRPIVRPNHKFFQQLREYEEQLKLSREEKGGTGSIMTTAL